MTCPLYCLNTSNAVAVLVLTRKFLSLLMSFWVWWGKWWKRWFGYQVCVNFPIKFLRWEKKKSDWGTWWWVLVIHYFSLHLIFICIRNFPTSAYCNNGNICPWSHCSEACIICDLCYFLCIVFDYWLHDFFFVVAPFYCVFTSMVAPFQV